MKTREFIQLLTKNGYSRVHSTGSHLKYRKGNRTLMITSKDLNKMIAKRLIKEYELEVNT